MRVKGGGMGMRVRLFIFFGALGNGGVWRGILMGDGTDGEYVAVWQDREWLVKWLIWVN